MSNLRSDCLDLLKSQPPSSVWQAHVKCLVAQIDQIEEYWHAAERKAHDLQQRLLSAAGDDLCRFASCERFHAQIAGEAGVNGSCLTLAQLIAENAKLKMQLEASNPAPVAAVQNQSPGCEPRCGGGLP